MALLPKGLREKTIRRMRPGEEGFTVPWAMFVDGKQRCFLNGDYTIHEDKRGTIQLRVMCQKDGYVVDMSACPDERWITGTEWPAADRVEVKTILGYDNPEEEEDIATDQVTIDIRKRRMQIEP